MVARLFNQRGARPDVQVAAKKNSRVTDAGGIKIERIAQAVPKVSEHGRGYRQQFGREVGRAGGFNKQRTFSRDQDIRLAGRHARDERREIIVRARRYFFAKFRVRGVRRKIMESAELRARAALHELAKGRLLRSDAPPE